MKAMRIKINGLKPCPFCESKVDVITAPLMGTLTFICPNCGADVMFYGSEHDVKKAQAAWNRRGADGLS